MKYHHLLPVSLSTCGASQCTFPYTHFSHMMSSIHFITHRTSEFIASHVVSYHWTPQAWPSRQYTAAASIVTHIAEAAVSFEPNAMEPGLKLRPPPSESRPHLDNPTDSLIARFQCTSLPNNAFRPSVFANVVYRPFNLHSRARDRTKR